MLIDAFFRESKLMRPKWDQKRGGRTYGERTIEKALMDTYNPKAQKAVISDKPKKSSQPAVPPVDIPSPVMQAVESASEQLAVLPSVGNTVSAYQVFLHQNSEQETIRVKSSFKAVDHHLHGFTSGLYILGAEPSIGKTTFCLQLAVDFAKAGNDVMFLSFEQRNNVLVKKLFACLRYGVMSVEETPLTTAEINVLNRIALGSDDLDFSIASVLQQIEMFVAEKAKTSAGKALPFVFIDYLQMLIVGQQNGARAALDGFVRGLRSILRKYECSIFLVSSLSRASYLAPVRLDSFKETGDIEYAGDVVLGLNLQCVAGEAFARKDIAERAAIAEKARAANPRLLQLTALKNRSGDVGWSVSLQFHADKGFMVEND